MSKQAQEERMKSKMITSTENDDNTSQKKTEARQEYGVGFHTPSSPQLSGKQISVSYPKNIVCK